MKKPGCYVVLIISTFILLKFFTPVSAYAADKFVTVNFSPAIAAGQPSCSSKYKATNKLDAAFLHAWNKTCWSCPKGYKRTVNPDVAGNDRIAG